MNKYTLKNIFRWIAILPSVALVYIITKLISDASVGYYMSSDIVQDLNNSSGLAGHYIFGTLYIFQKELAATIGAIYAGIYIARDYRRAIFFLLAGLWAVIMIVNVSIIVMSKIPLWTLEVKIRSAIELVAQLAGFIGVYFIYYPKDDKQGEYTYLLGERIYKNATPLVYGIAKRNPKYLSKMVRKIARERDISIKEAMRQHEMFGERIGCKQ